MINEPETQGDQLVEVLGEREHLALQEEPREGLEIILNPAQPQRTGSNNRVLVTSSRNQLPVSQNRVFEQVQQAPVIPVISTVDSTSRPVERDLPRNNPVTPTSNNGALNSGLSSQSNSGDSKDNKSTSSDVRPTSNNGAAKGPSSQSNSGDSKDNKPKPKPYKPEFIPEPPRQSLLNVGPGKDLILLQPLLPSLEEQKKKPFVRQDPDGEIVIWYPDTKMHPNMEASDVFMDGKRVLKNFVPSPQTWGEMKEEDKKDLDDGISLPNAAAAAG